MLGYLDPSNFLGGRLSLDRDAAERAFAPLAQQLGMTTEQAAQATITLASENIVGAIREITIAQGIDPREVTIVAGGGASGLNIVPIARELGCERVLLPRTAGALSACGALYSNVISEFATSHYAETHHFDLEAVNATLAGIERAGRRRSSPRSTASRRSGQRLEYFVDARYRAQVWELPVALPGPRFDSQADVKALEDAFHDVHERVFAVREPGQYLECLTWKVRATAELAKTALAGRPAAGLAEAVPAEPPSRRSARPGRCSVPRYDGATLPAGAEIEGPAVIREPTTTVVLYPGSRACRHRRRQLRPRRRPAGRDRRGGRRPRRRGDRLMSSLDPVLLAVISNRLDTIVREMENTLLRSGRSAILNMARDFSCAIVTGDNRLLATAEGLPVHVIGIEYLAEAMTELHDDVREGDAFLHNDPYLGNTHPADHTILVPVFFEGEHVFTAAAKAHQADCGNALPTTYMPFARDVYEEGGLIFPAVRIQRDYEDVSDVIRMCRRRIRVPDQWYGDYLAMIGAARIGERRLRELCARYGVGAHEHGSSTSGSTTPSAAWRARSARCRPARSSATAATTRSTRCPRASRST